MSTNDPSVTFTQSSSEHTKVRRIVLGAFLLLSVTYAGVIPVGLPYDEPAHWTNVLYYASHFQLPVLGDAGTSYESQQGPIFYILSALVVRVVDALGGGAATQFYAVRLFCVVQLAVFVGFAVRLNQKVFGSSSIENVIALVVTSLCPILIAIGASIQNDILALCFGFAAMERTVIWARSSDATGRQILKAAGIGVLVSFGLLTKLSVVPLIAAIPLWWFLRSRLRLAFIRSLSMLGVVAIAMSVFIIRNLHLYGNIFGNAGVESAGTSFPPLKVTGVGGLVYIAKILVAYLWVPTEYYRNVLQLQGLLQAALAAVTLLVAGTGSWAILARVRRTTRATGKGLRGLRLSMAESGWVLALSLLVGVLAFAMWLILFFGLSAVAPRIGYLALPAWLVLISCGFGLVPGSRARSLLLASIVALVLLNGLVLFGAATSEVSFALF